eukprot:6867633-Pyramimonas_sp.AAC.1
MPEFATSRSKPGNKIEIRAHMARRLRCPAEGYKRWLNPTQNVGQNRKREAGRGPPDAGRAGEGNEGWGGAGQKNEE